ncbi:MAG: type IV pilus assembly protein PilM [Candidatus Omnitrophica bacterium]|nr:type IV pilus assembly protein PilM [Candidatus Omnitrophota bacterium]
MFFKLRNPKSYVGIDIGSSSVKVVELSKRPEQFELLNFSRIPLSENIVILDSIKKAIREAKIISKSVNTSVSGKSVVVRYISLPKMTKQELKSAIKFEAEKYIPFSVQDVVLDAQIIGEALEDNKIKVILVAAKKDLIEHTIKLLEDCGLEPSVIDIDSFAIANAFQFNFNFENDNSYVLVDVGARLTKINIISKDISYLTRDVEIAGDAITRYLSDKLNIPFDEAEKLKCNPKEKEELVREACQFAMEGLFNEIRLSLDYYESHFEKPIEAIFLSGGTSLLKNLDKIFNENLNIETKVWSPIKAIKVGRAILNRGLPEFASQFAVSIGLALRSAQ